MRYITSGDMVILSELQMDDFHAIIGNGNRRMDFYNGTFTPNTGEIESIYSRYYSVIAEANFLINQAEEKLKDASLTSAERAIVRRSLGEALMFRAYCYNELANKFCQSYKNSKDVIDLEGYGLSLQLTYNPTTDNNQFPGRSSLAATYAQIIDDLDSAEEHITAFEDEATKDETRSALISMLTDINQDTTMLVPCSNDVRVSSDAVKAMKARVYLNMGEDQQAFNYAKEVLTGKYPLTTSADFAKLWRDDEGTEVIWCIESELNYHGNASGSAFRSNITNPDYVPTNECSFLYCDNDIRWPAWFLDTRIDNAGGTAQMQSFNKYPGNPKLYLASAASNFTNMAKPFRSAELYLICAEAQYNILVKPYVNEGDTVKLPQDVQFYEPSKYYLRILAQNRSSYMDFRELENATGLYYLNEIRNERHRELMGEGFRMTDLKRWNIGFKRGTPLNGEGSVIISNFQNMEYENDDHRFVWPIPQHEMNANPQIKRQNPGY